MRSVAWGNDRWNCRRARRLSRVLSVRQFRRTTPAKAIDGRELQAWQAATTAPGYYNNCRASADEADAAMKKSPAKKYSLVKGWFEETLTNFRPPSPIAVLRIDCDWHAPTITCLRALFPFVAEDGILIADGYPDWDGYARALHEYLAAYEGVARINQFQGLYYVVKGARKW